MSSTSQKSVNRIVAEWVSSFSYQQASAELIENAKLRILDNIGVMLATCTHDTVKAARRANQISDQGSGAYALVGNDPFSSAGAAFVNGVMASVLEFDDTHVKTNIHPTPPIISSVLAACQNGNADGKTVIEAVIVGSELICRLGLVSPIRLLEVGYHPTALYGVFGSVYAIAKLQQLDADTIAKAIGTAASLSAGSAASFSDGTSTKTLHVGFSASAALRAVALADAGISGPDAVYEGKFGFYPSHVQGRDDFNYAALTGDLGTHWEALTIAPKFYPCAYTLMPFIEATIALRNQHSIKPDDVAEIRCDIMARSFPTVCEPVDVKRRPRSPWHGRISLQHTVAEALVLGRMDKNAYSPASLTDPVINALADKVVHSVDPIADADTSRSRAVMAIKLKDGREVAHTIEDMPGTSRNPVAAPAYVAKFRANVAGVIPDALAEELIQKILNLENISDINPLLARIRSAAN
jgi:2-methylcitrate dehydratase PrpD